MLSYKEAKNNLLDEKTKSSIVISPCVIEIIRHDKRALFEIGRVLRNLIV